MYDYVTKLYDATGKELTATEAKTAGGNVYADAEQKEDATAAIDTIAAAIQMY